MEPSEKSKKKKVENPLTPESILVTNSLDRLKACGIPEIRTVATWANTSIFKDTSGNKTALVPFSSEDTLRFPTAPVRLVLTGDSPDHLHFQLRVHEKKLSLRDEKHIDAILVPYFFLVASYAKAAGAESLDIVNTDITYADSYIAIYGQSFEHQFLYKRWVNQQAQQNPNPQDALPFPNIAEERMQVNQNLQRLVYGHFPEGTLRVNFGIRDYIFMVDQSLPHLYRRLQELGEPLLKGEGLVGNTAAQQNFLAELGLLLLLYRQPDETFEQAVIATVGNAMLAELHDPINVQPLSALIYGSSHPLRSFIFVRAKLFQEAVAHALQLYYNARLPYTEAIRDFEEAHVGPLDLSMLGAIATGNLYLEKLDQGLRNFGFGRNDRTG